MYYGKETCGSRGSVNITCIAYKNKIIASDTLISAGNIKVGNTRKIVKTPDGWLAGACGDADYLFNFLDWARLIGEKTPKSGKDSDAILIDPEGNIYYYYGDTFRKLTDDYMAIGCGSQCALTAMWLGFDATKAVEAAIKFNTGCGGDIISENL